MQFPRLRICRPGWLVPLAVAALLDAGCNRRPSSPAADQKPAEKIAPLAVTTVNPKRADLHRAVSQPGFLQAYEATPIFAKLEAYVGKWHYDIGAEVKEGQVLADLDIPEMDVELAQKKGLVRKAQATLSSAQAKVKAVEAGVLRADADLKRWKLEQTRQARMVRQGTLDQQSVDVVNAQVETARAALAEAQAEVARATADVDVAKKDIVVAQANRDYVATLLKYAKVRAPFAGRVTRRNVDTGNFVRPAKGPDEKPLFVVERNDRLRIVVSVPEVDAVWVHKGAPATIRIQALPGLTITGKVARTSWSLDQTARTLRAEIDLKNPAGKFRPHMYAYVTITGVRDHVWTLPASAVVTQGDVTQGYQSFCYRVEDGKVRRTPVEVGARAGDLVEVLKKQVAPKKPAKDAAWKDFTGKEVIVRGDADKLTDGQEVRISAAK
jgi:multidrug efflux pump subunit AcrA (membrane-fusion protein)